MGRSKESFNKKEVRKKKDKKRKDKEQRKQAKKGNEQQSNFDDMIAYVDEYGNFSSEPPDPNDKEEIAVEDIELSQTKEENQTDEDGRQRGTISFFNDEKGFGFINELNTKQSVFVHANDLEEPVKENTLVSFRQELGDRGPYAKDVKIVR